MGGSARRGLLALMAGASLVASAASAGEKAAPEIALAGSTQGFVPLEDLKGQITVLCFYDDSSS